MEEKLTRSARHNSKNRSKSRKKKASLIGASLLVVPIANSIVPMTVQANEGNQQSFINSISDSAVSVASGNDLYASVMIAQALLESSSGNSILASAPNFNLFGIKGSYNGQSVYMPTAEYVNGEWITVSEPFRSYSSYAESFQDHADVLKNTLSSNQGYHYSGVWKSNTSNYTEATSALSGRYATDPDYAQKLNWLIETYGLTAYDGFGVRSENNSLEESVVYDNQADQSAGIGLSSGHQITVVSGDTLSGIAEIYGLTVDQLMMINGLTVDLITVGQQLKVA